MHPLSDCCPPCCFRHRKLKNPDTLVFSYTPVEDPAVYENAFAELMAHMAKMTGKKIRWFPAESYAAQV